MVNIRKPGISFRNNLTPLNKNDVNRLVQHHMAHPSWGIHDVHNFHRDDNGWAGIGYNYWIDFNGNIYEGRGMHIGAHTSNYNNTTIGIGYQGDFTKQQMTDAQLKAGIALNKWLMNQLPNVTNVNQIIGHNDLAATACPGNHFRMRELRNGVAGATTTVNTTQQSIAVDGKWGPVTTRALQSALGTIVDGIINSQPRNQVTLALYGGVTWGSRGSLVIRALQRKIGAVPDGKLGPNTIRALQRYLGTPVDGVISTPVSLVVQELQRRLNSGTF